MTCKVCNWKEIEDECHFVISCNVYIEIPQIMYNSITSKIKEFIHFNDRKNVIHIMKFE